MLRKVRAAPRIRRVGSGSCSGKLTLNVRVRVKGGHTRLRSIGSARFALAASPTVTVGVSLNALGRSLLRAGHGQLRASLVVMRTSPLPTKAQTSTVRLRFTR